MRKIKKLVAFKMYETPSGGTRDWYGYVGIFHKWGTSLEEDDKGFHEQTVGIVEVIGGTRIIKDEQVKFHKEVTKGVIMTPTPENMQFLNMYKAENTKDYILGIDCANLPDVSVTIFDIKNMKTVISKKADTTNYNEIMQTLAKEYNIPLPDNNG